MNINKLLVSIVLASLVMFPLVSSVSPVKAAELNDGTWDHDNPSAGKDTIGITLSTALSAGDFIYLTFNQGTDDVASSVSDATINATAATAVVDETNNTVKLTVPAGGASGSVSLVGTFLQTYDSTTYAQHSVAVNTTDSSNNALDYGVAVTVTDDNDNTVDVTASVPNFINMSLSDTTIDLGVLNTAAVNQASHTIGVNTNDPNGYMIQIQADGDLENATLDTIDAVTEGIDALKGNDAVVTAGYEEYGVAVTPDGLATAEGDYADNDTPIYNSQTNFISDDAAATNHVHTVTYRASIAGDTAAGTYTQVVTYTIATQ